MKLVCYCCAKPVGKEFALVTMQEDQADRVFIMLVEHANRADYAKVIKVKEIK